MRLIFGQLRGWKIRISIHASRMGCDVEIRCCHRLRAISIHASRMGCDVLLLLSCAFSQISIHASRMGCDRRLACRCRPHRNFNPRIPYGMRHVDTYSTPTSHVFQSTHPVWDATTRLFPKIACFLFQSTHPVWDATRAYHSGGTGRYFNPRIPYGMRLRCSAWRIAVGEFQSTHPVWDATVVTVLPLNAA